MDRYGGEDVYVPEEWKQAYENVEHGKAKMAAIRSAIAAADSHEDTPFQIFFRLELCRESCFYGDCMDMMVIFPEALAIADRYPETPSTCFDSGYLDEMDHILWVYKWVLEECSNFYQIPMSDCLKFFEDFKRRSQAYGYNLRPYYYYLYMFYEKIDQVKSREAFQAFEKIPRDDNCDCRACERNVTINYYLQGGQMERAAELAEEIENFVLMCGHDRREAWLRLKRYYMEYYLRLRDFEEAEKYCRILERQTLKDTEFQRWDDFLYCYAHRDMGKALRIYKAHWRDWEEERRPATAFRCNRNIARFFQRLRTERKKETIKLTLDTAFPLYQESGQYRLDDLYQYYYDRAKEVAERFDKRNGADYYCRKLEDAVY